MTIQTLDECMPVVIAPVETEFLDLDGDGVPDAVRTTTTRGIDISRDGRIDVVEVTEELASGIDIAGVACSVSVRARSIATSSAPLRNTRGKHSS